MFLKCQSLKKPFCPYKILTLLELKIINSHPTMIGIAKLNKHFFLPHRNDKYPAGMEPKNAPRLINDTTHDTSPMLNCLIPPRFDALPLNNSGVAGEDQPPTQPELRETMDAGKINKFFSSLSLLFFVG